MQRKDPVFTYGMENPKTAPLTPIDMSHPAFKDTTEILMPYFKEHPFIFNLQIEVTSRCNERCRHCYLPHHREMADMDTRLALDILDQAAEMKTLTCTLSGGECLLHKDFEAILRRARSHDMSVSILSNLTTLTDDMAALFREMNLSLVQVSLYSMNAEEHDAITCMAGSHAKTLAAIKKLLAANVPVQISCPTMEINYRSYREVLKWAYAHRMKAYTDHIMMARVDGTTSNLENRLTLGATETLIREMLQYDLEYKTYLDAPLPPDPPERRATEPVCGVGVDTLCVAANGTYYPCAGFQGYPLGDARVERLRNVWEESLPTLRLRNLTNADLPQCLACDAWQYCSRCFVRNFNENNGDMFKVSKHFCDVAFLNKRLVEEYWAVKNP
jgi:radical SAM protein with 4Fe4S-binding SPASM domain